MEAQTIWNEFIKKLQSDSLSPIDFTDEMEPFLSPLLIGSSTRFRRERFINSHAKIINGEYKKIVILSCPDDEYRLDFIIDNEKWKLCFIEGITLPISNIYDYPFNTFIPLPEKESWINAEKNISKAVHFFCRLKEIFGFNEALSWFNDGAGEFLCARSWVPFYNDSKAFISYCAWIENRINGEDAIIEIFRDDKCVIRLKGHLWFKVYHIASHIKTQLSLDEYKMLFEHIWKNRALHSGWNIIFEYDEDDTILTFSIHSTK